MLTIFTTPKPFRGHFGVIQRNAIRSWQRLQPPCEILLLGDDDGTGEVAKELSVRHIPHLDRNRYGTPLLNSIFQQAEQAATSPYLAYVNADIILMSDFLPAVRKVATELPRFLLVGRRWDLDIRAPLDFSDGWEVRLRSQIAGRGKFHGHSGIDYFVFSPGLWGGIPPFAIGRTVWDNWLIWMATSQKAIVIELTEVVTVVHQDHDYSHIPGAAKDAREGPEAKQNLALAGGYVHAFTLWDAKYQLTRSGIRRRVTPYHFYRHLVTLSGSHRSFKWLLKLVRYVAGTVRVKVSEKPQNGL